MAPRSYVPRPYVYLQIERFESVQMHSTVNPRQRVPVPAHWRVSVRRVLPAKNWAHAATEEIYNLRFRTADLPADSSVSEVLYALADEVRDAERGAT